MRKLLIIVLFPLALSGCGTTLYNDKVSIPADLTQECDPIPKLPEKLKMTDLVKADVQLIQLYKQCAARHASLIAVTK